MVLTGRSVSIFAPANEGASVFAIVIPEAARELESVRALAAMPIKELNTHVAEAMTAAAC